MKAICNALCKFPSSISGIETPPLSCCSASYLLHHSQHKSFQSCESHSKKHLQSSKKIYQWHVHIFQKKKKQFVLALNWHSFHHHKDHHQVSSSYGSSLALVGTSDETEPLLTRLHDSGQTLKPPSNSISFLESSKLSVFNHSSLQMNWIRQYWKDCQPLQDRGWNIWRCKYFKNSMFHIFNVGLFLTNSAVGHESAHQIASKVILKLCANIQRTTPQLLFSDASREVRCRQSWGGILTVVKVYFFSYASSSRLHPCQ